jgi:hypothetical protein
MHQINSEQKIKKSDEFIQQVIDLVHKIRLISIQVVQNIALWRHQLLKIGMISIKQSGLNVPKIKMKRSIQKGIQTHYLMDDGISYF